MEGLVAPTLRRGWQWATAELVKVRFRKGEQYPLMVLCRGRGHQNVFRQTPPVAADVIVVDLIETEVIAFL